MLSTFNNKLGQITPSHLHISLCLHFCCVATQLFRVFYNVTTFYHVNSSGIKIPPTCVRVWDYLLLKFFFYIPTQDWFINHLKYQGRWPGTSNQPGMALTPIPSSIGLDGDRIRDLLIGKSSFFEVQKFFGKSSECRALNSRTALYVNLQMWAFRLA